METKHTKGEWVRERTFNHAINVTAGKKGFVIAEVTGNSVIHFIGNEEEAEANARLITAAPDLLDCCMDILRIMELNPTNDNLYQRNKIGATIRKATHEWEEPSMEAINELFNK